MIRLLVALGLWLPLSLLTLLAIPISLVAIVFDKMPYGKNVLRTMDKLGASVLAYTGDRTISAECGASDCAACKWLCKLLDRVDPGHCDNANRKEK